MSSKLINGPLIDPASVFDTGHRLHDCLVEMMVLGSANASRTCCVVGLNVPWMFLTYPLKFINGMTQANLGRGASQ